MQEHFKGHPPSGGSSSKEHSVHDKGKPGTTQEAAHTAPQQAEGGMDALGSRSQEAGERRSRYWEVGQEWGSSGDQTHTAHVWCKAGSCC